MKNTTNTAAWLAYLSLLNDPNTMFDIDDLDGGNAPAPPKPNPSGGVENEPPPGDGQQKPGFEWTAEQQAEINRITGERASRASAAASAKLLATTGFSTIEEAQAAQKAIAKRNEDDLLDAKKYDEVIGLRDKTILDLQSQLTTEQTARRTESVSRTILAAANEAGAVNAAQVASLVNAHFRTSEKGTVQVIDTATGNVLTDGAGGELTPKAFIADWLTKNPHFKRAAGGRGSNSNPGGGTPPPNGQAKTYDPSLTGEARILQMKDPDVRADMIDRMRRGELKA